MQQGECLVAHVRVSTVAGSFDSDAQRLGASSLRMTEAVAITALKGCASHGDRFADTAAEASSSCYVLRHGWSRAL